MAIHVDELKVPDEFFLTQEQAIERAVHFFVHQGWSVQLESAPGSHDVTAYKNGWTAYIKCKGSKGKRQAEGMVYDSAQLRAGISDQIDKLMRLEEKAMEPSFFIMANPDIDRVKWVMSKLAGGLDKLDIIRMWIGENGEVKWDVPPQLLLLAGQIGLKEN